MVLLAYAAVCVAPTALFWGLSRLLKHLGSRDGWPNVKAQPRPPAIADLVADLSRIERESRRLASSTEPAGARRLRALELAYDDVLRRCQIELGLPQSKGSPLSPVERVRTEAALTQHGLHW